MKNGDYGVEFDEFVGWLWCLSVAKVVVLLEKMVVVFKEIGRKVCYNLFWPEKVVTVTGISSSPQFVTICLDIFEMICELLFFLQSEGYKKILNTTVWREAIVQLITNLTYY